MHAGLKPEAALVLYRDKLTDFEASEIANLETIYTIGKVRVQSMA